MAGAGIHPYHQQWPPAPAPQPSAPGAPPAPAHPPPILVENPNRPNSDEVSPFSISLSKTNPFLSGIHSESLRVIFRYVRSSSRVYLRT